MHLYEYGHVMDRLFVSGEGGQLMELTLEFCRLFEYNYPHCISSSNMIQPINRSSSSSSSHESSVKSCWFWPGCLDDQSMCVMCWGHNDGLGAQLVDVRRIFNNSLFSPSLSLLQLPLPAHHCQIRFLLSGFLKSPKEGLASSMFRWRLSAKGSAISKGECERD